MRAVPMWGQQRLVHLLVATAAAAMVSACAAQTSVRWNRPSVGVPAPIGPVFVMPPVIEGIGPPGNVGRDLMAVRRDVAARILAIVRERYPAAEMADPGLHAGEPDLPGYRDAVGGPVSLLEIDAARRAYDHGATHLLVPAIVDWKEMRTDDPIGAIVGTHSTVTITLRLMALHPAGVSGQVTFTNRARVTLNRSANGLLDDGFRKVVLRVIGPS